MITRTHSFNFMLAFHGRYSKDETKLFPSGTASKVIWVQSTAVEFRPRTPAEPMYIHMVQENVTELSAENLNASLMPNRPIDRRLVDTWRLTRRTKTSLRRAFKRR